MRGQEDGEYDAPLLQSRVISATCAALGGALLGVLLSEVVETTMVEISLSPFFAFYSGGLFASIGGIVMYKVCTEDYSNAVARQALMLTFSILVVAAGFVCFFFRRDWFLASHVAFKLPIYSLIGTAVSFALVFAFMDLVNFASASCCKGPPLFETLEQVYLLVGSSMLMGLIFGAVFAFKDVGSNVHSMEELHKELSESERASFPYAVIIGGATAAINQWMRTAQVPAGYAFDPLSTEDVHGI